MKKSMKIVSILMMAIMMVMVSTPVFASNTSENTQNVASVDAISAIDTVDGSITYSGNTDFSDKVGQIIGFLQWAGAISGVLILTIFGIKYMMGSLEEKAEYKKTMIPFIVGAIVLIAAPQIAKLIFSIIS